LILPHVGKEFDVDLEQTEAKSFLKEEMWLVSGGKELGVPEEIDIELYDEWPVINLVDEYPGFNRALKEAMGARYEELDVLFESSNVGTLKRVIESGMGWGFLPAHSIRKQVRSGRLMRTRVRDFKYDIDLVYYYKKDSEKASLIEVFYQTLSQSDRG
jgi:DNA-binding transcriptional LysR family regulator